MKKITLLLLLLTVFGLYGVEITRNGKAAADIAIPEKAVSSVKFAAKELQKFIKLMSGAELEIVTVKTPRKFANRIFIGSGAAPKSKEAFAWRIKADKKNLYLHGNDKEIYSDKLDRFGTIGEWRVTTSGSLLAVYDLLDREFGIYFIRPGDQGIVAPVKKSISVKNCDRESKPYLESASMSIGRPVPRQGGWKDVKFAHEFIADCRLWMLRNGMVNTYWFPDGGHSFKTYWERFSKSHPEYFALLIDGTRRPLPGSSTGWHIPMCISNSKLHDRLVNEWKVKKSRWHAGRWNYISACENDSPGLCTCKKCMSWNGPLFNPPKNAPYWGDKKVPHAGKRFTEMGIYQGEPDLNVSLSDRYCRFYLEILKKASKYNPNVKVYGYAYANYTLPPQEMKLNDRIMISYAGTPIFPMTPERMKRSKYCWEGWAKTGCLMEYRPNATWAFNCMPLQYTPQLCGEYRMALHTPRMRSVFFDALRCEFSTQGLMYYTLVRLTQRPDKTLDQIADEFFAVFGKAAPEVRRYYAYWQKVSDSITKEDVKKWEDISGIHLNIFTNGDFCTTVLNMKHFADSAKILAAAAKKADSKRAKDEVKFLQVGLEHARLTLRMQIARLESVNKPSKAAKQKFNRYYRELMNYRHAHEKMGISDMGRLTFYERYGFTKTIPWKKK